MHTPNRTAATSALCFAAFAALNTSSVFAQYTTMEQLPYKEVYTFTEAFVEGRPSLYLRARVEYVDNDILPPGQANTLATRLSFASASFQGFAGMIEFANTASYFRGRHNSGLPDSTSIRPVIADPSGSSVIQSFMRYTGIPDTTIQFGRQFVTLDNERMVGKESFRQTPQSFDGVTLINTSFADTQLFYGFLSHFNNFYAGNDRSAGQNALRDHWVNGTYSPFEWFKAAAYALIHRNEDVAAESSNTYGGRLFGLYTMTDCLSSDYAFEFARQHGRHNNPNHYTTNYYSGELGGQFISDTTILDKVRVYTRYQIFQGNISVDDHVFQTPLASNFSFNGLSSNFIEKPDEGLKDLEAGLKVVISDYTARVTWHNFFADKGHGHFGHEWDVGLFYKLNEYLQVSSQVAHFSTASSSFADSTRVWLSAEVMI